jgi:beta-glucanase (GH16 family)
MTKFLYSCILIFLSSLLLKGQIMWQFNTDSVITWHYEDGDEFNGTEINKTAWSDWYGWGRSISSNKEQQYYSKFHNHYLKNGVLILTAKREDVAERYVDWMNDNDSIFEGKTYQGPNKRQFTYTAGMLQSTRDYQYGCFEIKFRIPDEKGFWPAFWLYGGTPNEEIDWMELKTERPNQIHVGRHCQNKKDNYFRVGLKKRAWGDWVKFKGSLNSGYNIVSGIWNGNSLRYYLNGECIAIAEVDMQIPKKLVVNIAVSSDKGSYSPGPRKDFKDSVNFEVDYVRVWNRSEYSGKRAGKQPKVKEPVIGTLPIEKSSRISKSKLHYGKKEMHVTEGFFASIMPQHHFKYQLSVSGKNIPKNGVVLLKDASGNLISETPLTYGVTTFDLYPYQGADLQFIVKAFDKERVYDFTVN